MIQPPPGPLAKDAPAEDLTSFEQLLLDYKAALDQLEGWGVRINPSSRLIPYRTELEAALANETSHARVATLIELSFHLREMCEIVEIVASFDSTPSGSTLEKLEKLPGGTVHPDDELTKSLSRDLQYELALGAMLRVRGFVTRIGDSDVEVFLEEQWFPIEAKRPKSAGSLRKNVKESFRQLRGREPPGMAAISLDHVLRPRGEHAVVEKYELVQTAIDQVFHRYLQEQHEDRRESSVRSIAEASDGVGLIFTLRLPVLIQNDLGVMLSFAARQALWALPAAEDHRRAIHFLGRQVFGPPRPA